MTDRSHQEAVVAVAATAVAAALALTGCSGGSDSLSKQYGNGTTQNYISGDGAVTEVAADKRHGHRRLLREGLRRRHASRRRPCAARSSC